METEFITHEQALALKELGFDEPCFGFFNIKGKFIKDFGITKDIMDSLGLKHLEFVENICVAPTFSQAFRWFREKYNLFYDILQYIDKDWKYTTYSDNVDDFSQSGFYNTYEEAELECLKKLIEIVKEKNQ